MEPQSESRRAATDLHRIEIGVDWPPGHVALYLIDGPEPILVDAGMVGEQALGTLQAGLASAGRSLADIDHLLVTHPHVDHLGQIPALLDAGEPTVYAPAGMGDTRDRAALEAAVRKNGERAGLPAAGIETAVEKSVDSLERNRTLLDPADVDYWIDDGREFTAGGVTFRAIHTPGHQADHCCYACEVGGESTLFSGDHLIEPFRSVVLHAGLDDGVEAGVGAFYAALDSLDGLDVDRVCPGHGPTHDQFQGTIERSRQSLDRMLSHTRDQVGDGSRIAFDIAVERAGDRELQYVLPEVVGALAYLEADGRLRRTVEDGTDRYYRTEE